MLENTVMLYILTFSSYFFNFVTIPYQTRVLGPEIFGKIGFCLATVVYFRLFFDFGFLLSATEDVSKNREDKEELSKILSTVNILKLLFILISVVPLVILINTVPVLQDDKMLFVGFFIYVAIDCFEPDFLYRGIEKMRTITIRNVIVKAFFTVMIFIFLKDSSQYWLIPIFNILGAALALVLVYCDVFKRLRIKTKKVSRKDVKKTFHRSKMFFLSRIASTLYGATNTFVLGLIYPTGPTLGYYTSSEKILSAGRQGLSPISDSIFPHMVKSKDYALIKKVLKGLMPVITIACVLLFVFADNICTLVFGEEYVGSAVVLRYMVPIIFITLPVYLLGFPTMTPLGISNKANLSVIYSSIYHVIGIGILFVFGQLNLDSVCILTITTETLVLLLRVFYIRRELAKRRNRKDSA